MDKQYNRFKDLIIASMDVERENLEQDITLVQEDEESCIDYELCKIVMARLPEKSKAVPVNIGDL